MAHFGIGSHTPDNPRTAMRHTDRQRSRRLIRNVIILNSRSIITTVMGIIGTSLCLRAMGVESYGIYAALWGLVSLLGFLDTALRSASERYYAVALASDVPTLLPATFRSIRRTLLWLTLITGVVAEAAGVPVVLYAMQLPSQYTPSIIWAYQMAVITLLAGIIAIPYHSLLVASERMDIIARVQIIMAAYNLAGIACLHLMADKLVAYAALIATAAIITNATWYLTVVKGAAYRQILSRQTAAKPPAHPFLRFAVWNGLGEASFTVCQQGLNLLLNLFFGPVANAARAVAFQIQTFATKLFDNFRIPLSPQLIGAYAEAPAAPVSDSRAGRLLHIGSLTGTALMITFGVPVCFSCKGLLQIWLGAYVPTDTIVFSSLLIAGMIVDATSYFAVVFIKATGKVKRYYRTSSLLQLMSLPVAAAMLWLGAPAWTAPAVYVASQCAVTTYRAAYLHTFGMPTAFCRRILLPALLGVMASGVLCALVTTLIPAANAAAVIAATLLAMALSGAATYLIMIPRQAKHLITDIFRRS